MSSADTSRSGTSEPMATGYDLLVLSPHLDDGVLSVAGLMHSARARGERVLVATVFTADEPPQPPSRLARELHERFGLDHDVQVERRREDLAACASLGVDALHLDLTDALYRTDDATGKAFYGDLGSLFAPPRTADTESLVARLQSRFAELPPAARVLAPLGIGGHVDHRLVCAAADRFFGDRPGTELVHYEDYPYVQRLGALRLVVKPRRAWERIVVPLAEVDVLARIDAVAEYTSQVGPLFGDPGRMASRIRRYARRVGGERLWRRRVRRRGP